MDWPDHISESKFKLSLGQSGRFCERKTLSLNVSGLKRRIDYPDFVEFINKYDLFCVSETHLDSSDIVDIPGYTFIPKHRTHYKRKSGGIGIYVINKLAPFVKVIENISEYVLWIAIDKQCVHLDDPIILGAKYLPPSNSPFVTVDLLEEFENEISQKCFDFKATNPRFLPLF